ncbi:MAG: MFS transporter [archaeon]
MHLRKRGFRFKAIDKLGISYLVSLLGISSVGAIWSIYLDSFLHSAAYVGFATTLFTFISFLSYFCLIPILERYSKSKLYFLSLFVFFVSYLIFAFYSNFPLVIILGVVMAIFVSLRISAFGIIVRDKSKDEEVSKNEGWIYTIFNFGWFIGPLFAGYIASMFGFKTVFLYSAVAIFLTLVFLKLFKIKDDRKEKRIDYNIFKVSLDYFRNKERVFAYLTGGGVNFWLALIYVFIPVYIIESGFSDIWVGIFLAGVVIPTILTEYYFGKLAGRKGFKKMFFIGYLILSIAALLCFFFSNVYYISLIIIFSGFGASMIEPTTESYFFDVVNKKQRDRYYGPYNTSIDVGNGIATLVSGIILLFLPFKFIFLFFGVVMLGIALYSLKIKDIYEFKRR